MKTPIKWILHNKVETFILISGSIILLSIVIPYEKYYCLFGQCGLWLVDKIRARDDFWQIAIAQSSFNTWPFELPNASGVPLQGYHYLYSFILFLLGKIYFDPISANGFLYPIFWVACYSYLSFALIKLISKSVLVQRIFLFLQFFGGSFGYLLTLYHKKSFLFSEGMTYQPILYLTNKPLSLSVLLFLGIIILVIRNYLNTARGIVILSTLVFLTWGAKFHTGFAMAIFLASYGLGLYMTKKISLRKFIAIGASFVIASILSIFVFYRPDLSFGSGKPPLSWAPFSLAHGMIESPDMLYMRSLTDARYYLYSQNIFSPRLAFIEIFSAILYLFFMVGTRFIAVVGIARMFWQRTLPIIHASMVATILGLGFMMLGFVQNADWFNTMQFFTFAIIFLNIYTAQSLEVIMRKIGTRRIIFSLIAIIFVMLTAPFSFATVYTTTSMIPVNGLVIKKDELEALKKLEDMPGAIVFVPEGGLLDKNGDGSDRTIWKHNDISYVSALTRKQSYLSVQHQLSLLGINYEERKKIVSNPSLINIDAFDSIDYYYLPKEHPHYSLLRGKAVKSNLFRNAFENEKYIIYQRKRL